MPRLLMFILLLLISVVVGLEISRHPGYLLLAYHSWMVQMPLWFAAVSLIVAFVLFYIIVDSISRLQFAWFRFKNWLRMRGEHKSYSQTQHGLALLIEGRWTKAEKLLLAGVSQSVEPLMNYLGAAKAAQQQGAFERRDDYIKKAYQAAPDAELAIGLTQAELELEHNQLERAVATLNHLKQLSPRHTGVLKLLEKVYVRLADWNNLNALLPALRKAKLINTEQNGHFEKNIYCELFHSANHKNLAELQTMWNGLPRSARKNPEVVFAYVSQLLRFSATEQEIEGLIRNALKYGWQPELVDIYGNVASDDVNRQLVVMGAWLKLYGPKPAILLGLGKVCVRLQLWGKAKDYFIKCLAEAPCQEAALEYGKLLEQLGDTEGALQQYRRGLGE
jgi:HemY protein